MALVLAERDYKLFTLFTKIAGIFLFATGTSMLVDFGRYYVGLFLVLLGTFVVLAPVPMTAVRPDDPRLDPNYVEDYALTMADLEEE